MTPDTRVQGARELPWRVIRHDQPYLVTAGLQRRRLQLGVLHHGAPERPGERHHNADLHDAEPTRGSTGRRRGGESTAPRYDRGEAQGGYGAESTSYRAAERKDVCASRESTT